jgi:hypothetical protein
MPLIICSYDKLLLSHDFFHTTFALDAFSFVQDLQCPIQYLSMCILHLAIFEWLSVIATGMARKFEI